MQAEVIQCYVDDLFGHPAFAGLCSEAAAECADPDLSPTVPDLAFYRALENSGSARFFAVYVRRAHPLDEPTLAGFASLLEAPSGANGKRYATVERLFVGREYRDGGAGARLVATIEGVARESGCEAIFISAHVGTALARLMFLQCDLYQLTNHIFRRRLT